MPQAPIVVNIISLGCAKNLVDTEVMCGAIVAEGLYLAESEEDANVILINTCSFIRDARDEAEDNIRAALKWKHARHTGKRMVVVAGCLPQRFPGQTAKQFADVDAFIGLDDVANAAKIIKKAYEGETVPLPARQLPTYLYDHTTPRLTVTPESFAYLKIAEGCDHQCAFCAIPLFRGKQRSRSIDSIVTECKQLLDQGAHEINLVAQDSSRYGLDRSDGATLTKLLQACDAIDGDFWLRVLYTHPSHTTPELLDTMTTGRHVVPYLDMPIQHIATNVLKAMGRGIAGPQLEEKLHAIRTQYPSLTFRTTVLVGFPGETEDDFQQLLAFLKAFQFDRLGAFAYSPEEGTPAVKLQLPVPPPEIAVQRRDAILKQQATISMAHNKKLVNAQMTVLLEEPIDNRHWLARSPADAPDVDQTVTVKIKSRHVESPRFANVTITKAHQFDLDAEEQ